jgi:outer membrane protein OmpA-like peptidoglycan-associated protein
MRTTVTVLTTLAALGFASAASAQDMMGPPKGLYLGGGLGLSMPPDAKITGPQTSTKADLENFVGGMVNLGYAYPNNLRSEIELGYRQNDVESVGTSGGSGDYSTFNGMINLYYDIPGLGRWTPYLGAGGGMARLELDGVAPVNGSTLSDDDWVWAYQGIAGVGYQLTNNLGLFADYRYLDTTEGNFTTAGGRELGTDYTEHRVMVGLRWFFGAPAKKMEPTPAAAPAPMPAPAPAPAPRVQAPAPAPAPARNYLVFFDFDRADLKPDAQSVVRQAAQNFPRTQGVTRIEATGHADRSGTDAYNLRLSQRRAEAVRDELVRQGVPANQIVIAAKGEREPLVQTADGVREPQNRRVEIIIR